MSGEWPADPSDPRCPACGEPVSATASYCMHCETDLPTGDDAPMDEADPGMPTGDGTAGREGGGRVGSLFDRTPVGPDGAAVERRADEAAAWIDPDSLLDDVSTVVVGAVTAVLTLVFGLVLASVILPPVVDAAAPWLALAGCAAAGLWVGRTRSVFGAARKAGLTVGGLVALLPVAFAVGMPWDSVGDAVFGGLFIGVVVWPVAGIIAAVGWVLGLGGVDDGGEGG